MKMLRILIVLLLVSASFAQNNSQPKRIALIGWEAFGDPKTGVEKYAKALESLGNLGYIPNLTKEKHKAAYERQYREAVQPVGNVILYSLKLIEKENNLIILDGGELETKGLLLAFDEKLNITKSIIPALNDYFKTGVKPTLKLDLPETKIALINISLFENEKNVKFNDEIFSKLQIYAKEKSFSLILDSSKELRAELKNFQTQDVTKDFISYYNQMNP